MQGSLSCFLRPAKGKGANFGVLFFMQQYFLHNKYVILKIGAQKKEETKMNETLRAKEEARVRKETEGFSTTFFMDFSIADRFGDDAIKDTFQRAFKEWKGDYRYLTDLVLVLNQKIWDWYEAGNEPRARIYNDMWIKAQKYADENLKGEELRYYLRITD